MKVSILNRDFKHPGDGWYQIETPGRHPNAEAGVVQVIDAKSVDSIVNRFNQESDQYQATHGVKFPGMLIDHEHFKHQADKETVAYGWLMRLQNRNGKPFGQIRWTQTGKPAIDGGDYRFFSTEYDPKELQVLNRGKKPLEVRPLRLDGLSLTNDPNNKGGRPITNRTAATWNCDCGENLIPAKDSCPNCKNNFAGAGAPADSNQTKIKNKMKDLLTDMGLSAEASEATAREHFSKMKNRLTVAEEKVAGVTGLETQIQTLLGEQIEADFATAGITDEKIINRHKPLLSDPKHFKNRADRLAFIEDLAKPEDEEEQPEKKTGRVLNRGNKKREEPATEPVTQEELDTEVRKIMNRDGCKFEPAFNKLRREQPALFGTPQK